MNEILQYAGIILVFLAMISIFLYATLDLLGVVPHPTANILNSTSQAATVVYVGPVIVVLGTQEQVVFVAVAMGVLLLVLSIIFIYIVWFKNGA